MSGNQNHKNQLISTALNPLRLRDYATLVIWSLVQPANIKYYLSYIGVHVESPKRFDFWKQFRQNPAYRNLAIMSVVLTSLVVIIWPFVLLGTSILGTIPAAILQSGGNPVFSAIGLAASALLVFPMSILIIWSSVEVLGAFLDIVRGNIAGFRTGGASRLFANGLEYVFSMILANTRIEPFWCLEHHPSLGDEQLSIRLPGTDRVLLRCFVADFDRGLRLSLRVAMNESQRWAIQRSLSEFLASHSSPLSIVYRLTYSPSLDRLKIALAKGEDNTHHLSAKLLILSEIGQINSGHSASDSIRGDDDAGITSGSQQMPVSPIARFCSMLYDLLVSQAAIESATTGDIRLLERFTPTIEGIQQYRHGMEVAKSFYTFDLLLRVQEIEPLIKFHENTSWIATLPHPPLRPTVLEALHAFSDISLAADLYAQTTNLTHKFQRLGWLAASSNELLQYIHQHTLPPERAILIKAVRSWQATIAEEQSRLGLAVLRSMTYADRQVILPTKLTAKIWKQPLTPFPNPYIVGNPVYPPIFIGRQDVLSRINEIWTAKDNPDSIILFGHRRMGKTSILRNLREVAPVNSVVIYADMAGETSFVKSTGDLLMALADRVYAAIRNAYPLIEIAQPDAAAFSTSFLSQIAFSRYIEQVRKNLVDHVLIFALDEFEAIERAVVLGTVEKEIYQYLRSKTQEPGITLVFGGLHTLDEMSRDYQQPFYGSYTNIGISYFSHSDAWRLITNPTPDFDLNYEPAAAERIIAATGGQPYLVQLVCRDALDHLNHELFDEHKEREVKLTVADVEAVLGDDLFRRGTGYFDGVWTQVSEPAQQALLHRMARREDAWTLAELEAVTHLTPNELHQHLQLAQRRDILHQRGNAWEFCVPLVRRWIVWKE